MVLSLEMNGLGKGYIWSELFHTSQCSIFFRKLEEIALAISDLYCKRYSTGVDRIKDSKSIAHNTSVAKHVYYMLEHWKQWR